MTTVPKHKLMQLKYALCLMALTSVYGGVCQGGQTTKFPFLGTWSGKVVAASGKIHHWTLRFDSKGRCFTDSEPLAPGQQQVTGKKMLLCSYQMQRGKARVTLKFDYPENLSTICFMLRPLKGGKILCIQSLPGFSIDKRTGKRTSWSAGWRQLRLYKVA